MALSHCKLADRLARALFVGGLVWAATSAQATAQAVSADQITKALAPPITRSMNAPAEPQMSPADRAFVEGLRGRTRSLTVDEGEHVAEIAKEQPKIDLEIYFDFNSAAIAAKAEPQLNELAKSLRSSQLEGSEILLSGYTDAKGGAEYNQKLSEMRAVAVKKYLVEKLDISGKNLATAGYGKRDLKNSADPFAAENRRVQIVNLGAAHEAQR